MSGDLISRSTLIEEFYKLIGGDLTFEEVEYIEKVIEEIPIAYDVDKVVGQLEECRRIMESPVQQDCYGEECRVGDCIVCAFDKALDIVKAGGANG